MHVIDLVHVHFLVMVVMNLSFTGIWNVHGLDFGVSVAILILLHDGLDLLPKLLLANAHYFIRQVCVNPRLDSRIVPLILGRVVLIRQLRLEVLVDLCEQALQLLQHAVAQVVFSVLASNILYLLL